MDTNLLYQILAAVHSHDAVLSVPASAAITGMHPWAQVFLVLVVAVSPVIATLAAYWAKQTMSNTQESKAHSIHMAASAAAAAASSVQLAESVEQIHIAVNSERSKTLAEITALRDDMLEITRQKMALEEQLRDYQRREANLPVETVPGLLPVNPSEQAFFKKLTKLMESYSAPLSPIKK